MANKSFNVVDELIEAFPGVPPDDLCKALVGYLEASLPEILRSLELPPIVSPVRRKLESLRIKRLRRHERSRAERSHTEYDTFISELYLLRRQLDGLHDSCTSSEYAISDGNTNRARQERYFAGYQDGQTSRRFPEIEIEREALFRSPEVETPPGSFQPYVALYPVREELPAPNVTIDIQTQQRIVTDKLFADVTRTLEMKLVEFALRTGKISNYELVTQTDVEIPEWKRIVVKMISKGTMFDEKIELWDELDGIVRRSFDRLKQYSPSDSEALNSINRNLFLRMELI